MTNDLYWLLAAHLPSVGPAIFHRLLATFKNIETVFSASKIELAQLGCTQKQIDALKNPNWKSAEQHLKWVEENNCELISFVDDAYPKLLRELSDAPLLLYIRGDKKLLQQPQLAMVGSRHPSVTGSEIAEKFAEELANAGLIITSGLAYGIDAASHRGALRASGKTIAVLGAGLQHIYPVSHQKLAKEIEKYGALVSEFSPFTSPRAENFPRRNRIISGLSLGVLVVEAALHSGSLITARYAVEQNREVFAIPGSLHNPLARGCHQLIRQGAKLVETVEDILEEISIEGAVLSATLSTEQRKESVSLDAKSQHVLKKIGYEVTALDVIIARVGFSAAEVSSILLSLELTGYVRAVPGGYMRYSFNNDEIDS